VGVLFSGQPTVEVRHIGESLVMEEVSVEVREKVLEYQRKLNFDDSAWDELRAEKNPVVLATLLWAWLEHLKVG